MSYKHGGEELVLVEGCGDINKDVPATTLSSGVGTRNVKIRTRRGAP